METQKMIDELRVEIQRVKEFVNVNGYNNSTAINSIVRRYRSELKELLHIITMDQDDGLTKY